MLQAQKIFSVCTVYTSEAHVWQWITDSRYAKTVSIIGKPYYGKARTTFEILNEDQMFIKRFYLYDENARKIELFLEPGKYFIRANSGQKRGEVYGLRID